MAEASKLELLLLAKDKMSPALQRLLKLFKQAEKDGKSGASAIDNLTKKLERAPKSDGLKKHNAELKKTSAETERAAKAEEKLNNARRRKSADGSTGKETAEKAKLAAANEKAAKAEEKLNNARKRGSDGRLRDGRGKYVSDGRTPKESRNRSRRADGSFEEDLIQGGTGAGMLWASKKGMTAAMSKQEAMTDLRSAFYRSSLSAAELNRQMREGEKIADELGNKLPGTTADYIQMFTIMKQRGIETDTVLKGAGKSAAYLAVANKEDREDVAKNIARFGQMFNLKTEKDYMGAADLMSRAKTTYGITSAELMEAVKDFSGRTGKGLGLDGQKGAEDTLRYLSFLRAKTGLEGLTVGNAASSFFNQYLQAKQKKKDPTEDLKKLTGVDLKIFDEKGKFKGLENAVKEFSKLKGKLTDEQQTTFGNALAGEEGASIFQAMVKNGDQWAAFNNELTESISLQDKSAKNAENLTNKLEALTGSLENLGSASFGPLLGPLSKGSDGLNTFVGYLTDVAKARPALAGTTAAVATLAGAFLALKGGSGLASRFMGGANSSIVAVGDNATKSATKVGKLRGALTSTSGIFKVLLAVELAGATWDQINSLREAVDKWKEMNKGVDDAGKQSYKAQQQEDELLKSKNQAPDYKKRAQEALGLLQQGNKEFEKALDPKKMGWYEWYGRGIGSLLGKDSNLSLYQGRPTQTDLIKNPQYNARLQEVFKMPMRQMTVDNLFKDHYERVQNEIAAVKNLQSRVPMLNDPKTMSSFRRDVMPSMGLSDIRKQFVEQLLQQAFPDSFKQASLQLASSQTKLTEQNNLLSQTLANLQKPTEGLVAPMSSLTTNSNSASNATRTFANSANSAASRMSNMQITPPIFSPIKIPVYTPVAPNISPDNLLGRATGGGVKRGHKYEINERGQEFFTPSQSGSIVSNDALRKTKKTAANFLKKEPDREIRNTVEVDQSKNISKEVLRNSRSSVANVPNLNFTVHINVDGSQNPKETAIEVKRELAAIISELKEEWTPRKVARKVAYEAERDAELT